MNVDALDGMLIGQLLISMLVAIVVACVAAVFGHGVLGVLLLYSASGSLTLLLLAAITAYRSADD